MARPVTPFTGQWADMPIKELAPLAKEIGCDGLELACWGDHFEVDKALESDGYVRERLDLLHQHGIDVVSGFTGGSIWDKVCFFPPTPPEMVEKGFRYAGSSLIP